MKRLIQAHNSLSAIARPGEPLSFAAKELRYGPNILLDPCDPTSVNWSSNDAVAVLGAEGFYVISQTDPTVTLWGMDQLMVGLTPGDVYECVIYGANINADHINWTAASFGIASSPDYSGTATRRFVIYKTINVSGVLDVALYGSCDGLGSTNLSFKQACASVRKVLNPDAIPRGAIRDTDLSSMSIASSIASRSDSGAMLMSMAAPTGDSAVDESVAEAPAVAPDPAPAPAPTVKKRSRKTS